MPTRSSASDCQRDDGILRAYEAGTSLRSCSRLRVRVRGRGASARGHARPGPGARRRAPGRYRSEGACASRARLRSLPRLRDGDVVLHLQAVHAEGPRGRAHARPRISRVHHVAARRLARAERSTARRGRGAGECARRATRSARLLRVRRPDSRRRGRSNGLLRPRRQALGIRPPSAKREPVPVIDVRDVEAAAARLDGIAHRTPVLTSRTLDGMAGASVHLKAENFQRGGAFKFRGAYNKIASLPEDARGRGVLAYSSGNHAQAVAIAATLLGTRATIVMPEDAPPAKLDATRGYGAELILYDRWREDREAIGSRLPAERGVELVRPYDDPLVMAGQGTVALELLADAPDLDVIVTPVGGGGLIAGCATVAKPRGIRVVGVEPETGNKTARSLAAGERIELGIPHTIADGLQAPSPGELTFQVNRERVDEVVTVSDEEIVDALAFLFDRLKLRVEPSGAVGVAALLARRVAGQRIGIVLSGGNVGAARFAELVRTR